MVEILRIAFDVLNRAREVLYILATLGERLRKVICQSEIIASKFSGRSSQSTSDPKSQFKFPTNSLLLVCPVWQYVS